MAFRAEPRAAVALMVVMVVNALGTSLIGVLLARLVDRAGEHDVSGVLTAVVLGAVCQALLEVGFRTQFSLRLEVSQRVDVLVQQDIAEVAGTLRTLEHLEDPAYLDRIASLRQQSNCLADSCWSVLEALSITVQIVLAVSFLAVIDPLLMALVVLALPSVWLTRRARAVEQRAMDAAAERGRLADHLLDVTTQARSAKEVCITNSSETLRGYAAQAWDEASSLRLRAEFKTVLLNLCGFLVFTAGFLGALAYAIHASLSGTGKAGEVILVITLAGRLQGQVGHAVWVLGRLLKSVQVADRYVWLQDRLAEERTGATTPPSRLQQGISLRNVSFRYPGTDRDVIHDLSLDIPAGGVIAVVGENGAGKTTLVKLLSKLYEPTSGALHVDGIDLADIDTEEWRAGMTATYQDYARLEFLVRESVGVGKLARIDDPDAVREGLERAGALGIETVLPNGLDTRLGLTFDGVDLSLGQWQRLALARSAMRRNPLLMVLDEPTASLDAKAEHDLYERFTRLSREVSQAYGSVTVLVTHRFSTVQMADVIVVVHGGRIAELGTHEELLAAAGLYSQMYQSQARAYVGSGGGE
ncbi:ABC transporter ATP-binding protein [Streptomyces sp. NBC_00893]|uniref:ABC transporter ATP-binding protein n=1 Tax=Streptomyces sp. NBC_00893 TaxID=2975862 RepID=UPI00225120AF|nr:ABC transporter ATP-binding protein [Streptomyces sp. NBC_00893]MCX4850448.1 ABC transporter ATP-binding protein/permease [Streptomyces sp. NBC_00893]